MPDDPARPPEETAETLRRLEQRLARIESHLGLPAFEATEAPLGATPATAAPPAEGELEFVVGQNWFASVGIIVLTCGVGFALSLPLAGFPPFVPSLTGGVVAAGLLLLALRWRTSFELVAGYFRGAGMALLYFAVLRLFFFGTVHAMDINSAGGRLLLAAVVTANAAVALRRRSAWLLGLALVTGLVTTVAVGAPWFVFTGITLLLGLAAYAVVAHDWKGLLVFIIPTAYFAHLLWLVNRPWSGREVQVVASPVGVFAVLAYVLVIAMASLRRPNHTDEDPFTIVAVLLNCGGYVLFSIATMGSAKELIGPAHLVAAAVFLMLAVVFWMRVASKVTTFFYAMTGYLALSVAIAKLVPIPEAFIWLSGQSLLVMATALWFRSRLIVVGNFFIYAGIVVAYMASVKDETGISIGFGVVALVTARVLRWQQHRLNLTTEMMRNAYLASAFIVFPYSLYHLVPRAYVTVSWVGVAVAYYLMNLIVRSPKYRWMGHLTLLGTAIYVIGIGIFQLAPAYRIASFLVLGTVLLVVSLIFTQVRSRKRRAERAGLGEGTEPGEPGERTERAG